MEISVGNNLKPSGINPDLCPACQVAFVRTYIFGYLKCPNHLDCNFSKSLKCKTNDDKYYFDYIITKLSEHSSLESLSWGKIINRDRFVFFIYRKNKIDYIDCIPSFDTQYSKILKLVSFT